MIDRREEMRKAVEAQIGQLAHFRGIPRIEAAGVVAQSFARNLADSRGTSMEPYWEIMLSIADGFSGSR